MTVRGSLLLIALLSVAAPLAAQTPGQTPEQVADSLAANREPLFVLPRDLYVAAGFTAATVALFPLDRHLAEELQDSTIQAVTFARKGANALSTGAHSGDWFLAAGLIYGVGRLSGRSTVAEAGLHTAEGIVLADATARLIKGLAGRARPNVDTDSPHDFKFGRGFGDSDFQSFPSGHTTGSFAAAAALTSEISHHWPAATWIAGPILYGTATLVGVSRMYNNNHWGSDVAVGAAIGTFSGLKVVRYTHSHRGNFVDGLLLSATILPDRDGGVRLTFRSGR